jgi:hypothetical protein
VGDGTTLSTPLEWLKLVGPWITGGLAGAIVTALLGPRLTRIGLGPRLRIISKPESPHCNLGGAHGSQPYYWMRLIVENRGFTAAQRVEVAITRLKRDGKELPDFLVPLNIKWSHTSADHTPWIAPNRERHCEFGMVYRDSRDPVLVLQTEPRITPTGNLSAGEYDVELIVSADNAAPKKFEFVLYVSKGKWSDTSDSDMARWHRLVAKS